MSPSMMAARRERRFARMSLDQLTTHLDDANSMEFYQFLEETGGGLPACAHLWAR